MTSPKVIDSFTGDYDFLSNFYPCRVKTKNGITYPSSEHAYQAAKFLDKKRRLAISQLPTAMDAKSAGREKPIRPRWDLIKVGIMMRILRAKFRQNKDLADKLVATGDAQLIEGNWWKDTFWGWYKGEGKNMLGKVLMVIRLELIADRDHSTSRDE